MMRLAVVLVIAVTACKGDAQKCEQACRNHYTLVYWAKTDAEIAAAPEAGRKLLRQQKLSEFTNALETGVEFCVQQCRSANNDEQVDCMIAARTAEASQACIAD